MQPLQRQESQHFWNEAPLRPSYLILAPSTLDTPITLTEFTPILYGVCELHALVIRPSNLWVCGFVIASLQLEPLEPLEPLVPTELSVAIFQADDGPGLQIEIRPVHETPDYAALADTLAESLGLHFRSGPLVMRPKK